MAWAKSRRRRSRSASGRNSGIAGRLFVIAGPSGVGKGTLIRKVLESRPGLVLSVSWTTRAARPGEMDGREYHFVSEEEFQKAIDRGELLEWEEYRGAWYGTPWSEVRRALEGGRSLVLEIDVRGARSVKARFAEAVTIFIAPPSIQALEARLRGRGTDSEEKITARLEAAREEMSARDAFDHAVLNDDVHTAAEDLRAIIDVLAPPPGGSLSTSEDSP